MLLPILYLALRASEATPESWELILRDRTVWLAVRSVGLATAVTSAAVALAVPLAWLTVRSDVPMRRLWSVALALPLVIPSYVGAFAFLAAFGPKGLVQQILEPFGVDRMPDPTGFWGAFIVLTLFTYPYVFLLVAASLKGLDPALEETARGLGRSRGEIFRRVTLPLLRPSIAAGGLLVALYTLLDFGAVSLMRYPVFTQAIYLQYKGAFDRTPAAILSLMLVGIALVVVAAEQRARGRARYYRVGSGSRRPLGPVPLGRWKWVAFTACAVMTLLALIGPLSVLVYWFARSIAASDVRLTWGAAGGSVVASGLGAALTLLFALPIAVLGARYRTHFARMTERLAYTGYALPGLVVALSLVFLATRSFPVVYQSLALMVFAYAVLFLPQAAEPLRNSFMQIGPRVEEAGRALGRSRPRVFVSLVLPLISRGALAGGALVFLTAMKELPATLLLRPTGFETLATRIWSAAAVGLYSRAAGPALLLILVCCVPLYVLARRLEVKDLELSNR